MTQYAQKVDPSLQLAGPDTPLIRSAWYVAETSIAITRKPIHRRILDQDILLYRTEQGDAVALQNRCAHRGFPLDRGVIEGDEIICPYHGIRYAPDGVCTLVPTLGKNLSALSLQHYATVELGPFVWVWMGVDTSADLAGIPDQSFFTDPSMEILHGSCELQASYVRMHENLMDLSHFPFLHGQHGVGTLAFARRKIDVRRHGDRLCAAWNVDISAVSELRLQHTPVYGRQARRIDETWFFGPGCHGGGSTCIDLEAKPGEKSEYVNYIYHYLTPISARACRYFWAVAFDIPFPPDMKDAFRAKTQTVFDEDVVACEAMEDLASWEWRPNYREKNVPSDRPGLFVRNLLHDLALRDLQSRGLEGIS